MPLWRCQNARCSNDPHGRLIFDFEADEPVCPECGTDGRKSKTLVIPLKVLHFNPPHARVEGRALGHAACNKALKVNVSRAYGFTGDPKAVNCPKCKATHEWGEANAKWDGTVYAPGDFGVTIDPAKQTVEKADKPAG